MIYTELTKKAMRISFSAHKEQRDKSEAPYAYHPFLLASQMKTESEVCTALLHDVIEDADWTAVGLRTEGFPEEVLDAVALMTHDDAVPYMEYVAKIAENPIARAVKIADLRHNSDLSRLDEITEKAIARAEKYRQALTMLLRREFSEKAAARGAAADFDVSEPKKVTMNAIFDEPIDELRLAELRAGFSALCGVAGARLAEVSAEGSVASARFVCEGLPLGSAETVVLEWLLGLSGLKSVSFR